LARVRGEITSAYIELKAVFTSAPELPYPALDQNFTPVPAADPSIQSIQERLNVYKNWRDALVQFMTQNANALDAQRNLIRQLAGSIRN
jgi:hypothetical protein